MRNVKMRMIRTATYYPYGEPTIEPAGQRWLFGGKEREHAGGRNSYDYGARNLTPLGSWSSADPLATDFYPLSPFSYCGGDPINRVDPDGQLPLPIIMFLMGAGIDLVTQVSLHLVAGESFCEAFGNIDLTSTLASGATSAILGPASSHIAKSGAFVINAADAAIDIKLNGSVNYLGGSGDNEKELSRVAVSLGANTIPGFIKHSPISLSSKIHSTGEIIGKDWSEQELKTTTQILFDISGDGINRYIRMKKENQNKLSRHQIVEQNDATRVNPRIVPTVRLKN